MKGKDFPFTILDVIHCLGLEIRKVVNSNEYYIDCPNHPNGHKGNGKVQVILTEGIYNCPHCGEFHGGMLDLYCYYRNCDRRTANAELRKYVNAPVYTKEKAHIRDILIAAENKVVENNFIAKKSEIDYTYRTFLSLCDLKERHKADLIRRGLSEKHIAHYGFKSCPVSRSDHSRIINKLLEKGCRLEGVPGFFINKRNNWDFNIFDILDGYIVPMMNLQNQCLGLQIRLDKPIENKKYFWFSSKNKKGGCGRTSVPHISNIRNIGETVYLTEGGLKANVAHVLGNRTFVAIAGVTQFNVLPVLFNQLKQKGVKVIVDSYDSDCKYNKNVEKARQKLKKYVISSGLTYYRMEWDEQYKGIDDYLLAVPKGQRKFTVYDR